MKRMWVALAMALIGLGFFVFPAAADGIIIPLPPICLEGKPCSPVPPICLEGKPCPPVPQPCLPTGRLCPRPRPIAQLDIKYHHVTVTIDNQVAVTHVDQVFSNPNDYAVEGTYVFPLPADAAVGKFVLWIDGEPVEGKVLSADEARKIYDEYLRQMRDPALLEYAGRGAVQAHIFPIPPNGTRRIELEYSQTLAADNGLVRYIYPLNTEKFSASPLEDVSVTVQISSLEPLRAIYSPSHAVQVDKKDDTHATASYEEKNVTPDTDFTLFYSVGQSEAFHLLTYRDPHDASDPDGFFLLLLAPRPEKDANPLPKDVILVLDHSGSMDGEKFRQAQAALKYILQHLNKDDRFGLEGFSSSVELYANNLHPASDANEAVKWVDQMSARGSTDINRALLESVALADQSRPTYLIFLTDGLPTLGETRRENILSNFAQAAPASVRLFPFGVGNDVDTFLLDSLAQEHHGLSTYIRPGQALDEVLSGFYDRISTPALTNISLDFGGISTYDIYPNPLPDLFLGGQVIVLGRYRDGGTVDVSLKGSTNSDQTQTLKFPEQRFTADSSGDTGVNASLPRLWATRKVGYLLNKLRLSGPDQETIDQIVKLSIRYGIVTPYTSYLVDEPMPLGADNQQNLSHDAFRAAQAAPAPQASGAGAVDKAQEQGGLSQAQQAPTLAAEAAQKVQVVGSRTFVYSQDIWMDTQYDPKAMNPVKVAFLSADYYTLAARPDLAAALALGEQVIVVLDGKAYQVVAENAQSTPVVLPPTPNATATPAPFTGSTPQPIRPTQPGLLPVSGSDPSSGNSSTTMLLIGGAALVVLLAVGLGMRKLRG